MYDYFQNFGQPYQGYQWPIVGQHVGTVVAQRQHVPLQGPPIYRPFLQPGGQIPYDSLFIGMASAEQRQVEPKTFTEQRLAEPILYGTTQSSIQDSRPRSAARQPSHVHRLPTPSLPVPTPSDAIHDKIRELKSGKSSSSTKQGNVFGSPSRDAKVLNLLDLIYNRQRNLDILKENFYDNCNKFYDLLCKAYNISGDFESCLHYLVDSKLISQDSVVTQLVQNMVTTMIHISISYMKAIDELIDIHLDYEDLTSGKDKKYHERRLQLEKDVTNCDTDIYRPLRKINSMLPKLQGFGSFF